ncbi:MAG: hypothetical protein AAF299_09975, partial [Pseudomonadota bacterium]
MLEFGAVVQLFWPNSFLRFAQAVLHHSGRTAFFASLRPFCIILVEQLSSLRSGRSASFWSNSFLRFA